MSAPAELGSVWLEGFAAGVLEGRREEKSKISEARSIGYSEGRAQAAAFYRTSKDTHAPDLSGLIFGVIGGYMLAAWLAGRDNEAAKVIDHDVPSV
jgi:hypothetical protein